MIVAPSTTPTTLATAPTQGSPAAGPSAAPSAQSGHLPAVDVVRFLTVAGVIAVHTTSLTVATTAGGAVAAGVVLSLLHVTREVFIFLSAFVLGYRYRSGRFDVTSFWKRRYLLVGVPYVAWSLIYVMADGHLTSIGTVVGRFFGDLATGDARFHLYFLLVTFQMYAVFPWVIRAVRRARPGRLLAISFAVELLFMGATHYWSSAPGVVGTLLNHSGSWLWSYQFYFVAGLIAAIHLDAMTEWVRAHGRLIAAGAVAAAALGLTSYYFDLHVMGMAAAKASEVLQPTIVIESIAAIAAQYAFGLWVIDRLGARGKSRLLATSDASFGVYLSHPLIVQGVLDVAVVTGLTSALGSLSPVIQLLLVLGVLVPVIYLAAGALVALARRTPLSVALTGRRVSPGRRP